MKKTNCKLKERKAITLIALVITIVVLIILAAVAINITLGENGLFNRAKFASEKQRYEAAKEKIDIEITNIKMKCIEEGKLYNETELENALADNDEFIIQYYFPDTAAVRTGATKPAKVKAIGVSTKDAQDFVFKIDTDGEIQGVTKTKNPASLTESSFTDIDEYVVDTGETQGQEPTPTPTPTPTPADVEVNDGSELQIGDSVIYRNTNFTVWSFNGNTVRLMPNQYRAHMVFKGSTSDANATAADTRIHTEMSQAAHDYYANDELGITYQVISWNDSSVNNYKIQLNNTGADAKVMCRTTMVADNNNEVFWSYFNYYYVDSNNTLQSVHYDIYGSTSTPFNPGPENLNGIDLYLFVEVYMDKNLIKKYTSGWRCNN